MSGNSTTPTRSRGQLSTRLLLTCAAIGVAGGFVALPTVWATPAIFATVPWLYGILVGAYIFPGVIAQALIRRPGMALVTATLAGIVAAPFFPGGFGYIPFFIVIGVLQEVPFAVSRFRYWKPWVFYTTALVVGLAIAVGEFVIVAGEHAPLWIQIVKPGLFIVSLVLFTFLGRSVAAGLARAGLGRGLMRHVDQRKLPVTTSTTSTRLGA